MKRFFCCFKGESSSNAVQDPMEQQLERVNNENAEVYDDVSFENNLELPDDREVAGESSSNAVQDPQEQQLERVNNENAYDDEPFGNNDVLNHYWRNNLELPDDREVADPNATLFPIFPPLPANCGRPYQWHEILDGTLNFRQTNFLGRGNFGEVYRCRFSRTNEVGAVKVQNRTNPTGHHEFLAEVTTLHAANHRNVIKLLGRCYGRRNRAIVYELMPNGSLDRHIFANPWQGQGPRVLDWDTRMRIAVGVAEGLVYLHQVLKVINRDVKAGNILLDANFVPKLTDFGLATKIIVNENGVEQQSEINLLKGTPGCIAPEAEQYRLVSTKTDVYSYGVFLFMLFTGRKAFEPQKPVAKQKLTEWYMRVWTRFRYAPVDVALGSYYSVEGLSRIYHTARMCINAEPLARPAMSDVETMVREAAACPVQVVPRLERRHSVEVFSGDFIIDLVV